MATGGGGGGSDGAGSRTGGRRGAGVRAGLCAWGVCVGQYGACAWVV